MGFSLSDLQAGVADVGKIIQDSSNAIRSITAKPATAPVAVPNETKPQTAAQPQGTPQAGFAVQPWMILAGVVVAVIAFRR